MPLILHHRNSKQKIFPPLRNTTSPNKPRIHQHQTMSTLVTTINTIGLKLPQEKQAEIKENLANLFASVEKAKEDAKNVVVEDHLDTTGMQLAREVRLQMRKNRLDAVNALKARRDFVKQQKEAYDTEDKIYLKLIQTVEAELEPIEKGLLDKEKTAELYAEQQRKLRLEARLKEAEHLLPFIPADANTIQDLSEEKWQAMIKFAITSKEAEEKRLEEEKAAFERKKVIDARKSIYRFDVGSDISITDEELFAMSDDDFRAYKQSMVPAPIEKPKAPEPEHNIGGGYGTPIGPSEYANHSTVVYNRTSIAPKSNAEWVSFVGKLEALKREVPSGNTLMEQGCLSMIDKMITWVKSKM